MTPPLVSIVVDSFNYARFLRQCIDSALAQTYAPLEVIVVDDASTDESPDIIRAYGGRIKAVIQPRNRGQAAAFNAGFALSSGDIVMFLDADDWLYPLAAERVVASWVNGESKTHFRLALVDRAGDAIDVHPAPEVRMDQGDVVPALLDMGRYETSVTTGNAFARAALQANMPIPEDDFRIGADGYLATVVPFHGPVVTIEERLGAYRVHGANTYAAGEARETPASFCVRLRRRLDHDIHKDKALRAKTAVQGVPLGPARYLRDPLHLELRLASLRLDPPGHPFGQDRRLELAVRGIAASRRLRLNAARRLLMAGWFLAAGVLPARTATAIIRWKMMPANRPAAMDRLLKKMRRALG
jgi:glycosyltransferase involved in cell wall biosynthesis